MKAIGIDDVASRVHMVPSTNAAMQDTERYINSSGT